MNLIHNIHFVFACLRRKPHLFNKRANIIYRVVTSCIQLVNIKGSAFVKAAARVANITGFTIGLQVFAVYGFGKYTRASSFANTPRSTKQKCMRKLLIADCIF